MEGKGPQRKVSFLHLSHTGRMWTPVDLYGDRIIVYLNFRRINIYNKIL